MSQRVRDIRRRGQVERHCRDTTMSWYKWTKKTSAVWTEAVTSLVQARLFTPNLHKTSTRGWSCRTAFSSFLRQVRDSVSTHVILRVEASHVSTIVLLSEFARWALVEFTTLDNESTGQMMNFTAVFLSCPLLVLHGRNKVDPTA